MIALLWGAKREIVLIYGNNNKVEVTLRRLRNRRGHVQIRYAAKSHSQFREWLKETFEASKDITVGEILEFHKISKDRYLLKPITAKDIDGTDLCVSKTMYHGGAKSIIPYLPSFKEVLEVIQETKYEIGKTQSYYNQRLKEGFIDRKWSSNRPIIEELNLRYDYRKENIQIEVEFGNARTYYQDYLKFSVAFTNGLISLGGLIVPTADFASILCEIGKEKAWQRAREQGLDRRPTYSGMMTYEKASREFQYIKFMLNMPIVIMGIDYK